MTIAIPLTPEQATALMGISEMSRIDEISRTDEMSRVDEGIRGVALDISVDGQMAVEGIRGQIVGGVRGGIRGAQASGVRGGIRGAESSGIRGGVRGAAARRGDLQVALPGPGGVDAAPTRTSAQDGQVPRNVALPGRQGNNRGRGRLADPSRQAQDAPLLAFEATFKLLVHSASSGSVNMGVKMRSSDNPQVEYLEVKTTVTVNATPDGSLDVQVPEQELSLGSVALIDSDGDGVSTLTEAVVAGVEAALDSTTKPDEGAVKITYEQMAKKLEEKMASVGYEVKVDVTNIDLTPPDTTIVSSKQSVVSDQEITFTFSCNETFCAYRCALSGPESFDFTTCVTPLVLSLSKDGEYTLSVKAADTMGNTDLTPATIKFFTDITPPEAISISIESGAEFSNKTLVSVAVKATDENPMEMFLAQDTGLFDLKTVVWIAYAEQTKFSMPTGDGKKTVYVQFRDKAGNRSKIISDDITLDTKPPETAISGQPSAVSNKTSATFVFSCSDQTSPSPSTGEGAGGGVCSFFCQLDVGTPSPCASPLALSPVEGSHTFSVYAVDKAGNKDTTPATFAWTVDTTPPDTTISGQPSAVSNQLSASFAFSSPDGSAAFQCRLDQPATAGSYAACTSPLALSLSKGEGSYTFSVQAIDPAGNTDASPASHTWTIDLTPPTVTITAQPTNPSTPNVSFTFTSNDTGATFTCALDSAAFASCTSPKSYSALADGSHTFQVKGTDAVGNTSSAVSYTWSVDATPPTAPVGVSITVNQNAPGSADTIQGSVGSVEGSATVKVWADALLTSLLGQGTASASGVFDAISIGDNTNATVYVTATDAAGNQSSSTSKSNDITSPNVGTVIPASAATATHVDSVFDLSASGTDASVISSCEYTKNGSTWLAAGFADASCSVTGVTCTDGQSLTLNIRVTDAYGNVGTGTAVSRTCDAANPTCSVASFTEGTNPAYQHSVGTSFYYNTATTGDFTVNVTASDGSGAGVQDVSFPATVSAGGNDSTSPYSLAYSWVTGSTYNAVATITVTDKVGYTGACNFAVTRDVAAPTGATITYANSSFNSLSVPITLVNGTDADSGVGQRILQTKSATYSNSACGAYGSFTNLAVNPTLSYSDTSVLSGYCWQYQYLVYDNVNNVGTFGSANTAKVDTVAPTFGGVSTASGVSDAQIGLTWAAATDGSTSGANLSYDICRSTAPGGCAGSWSTSTTYVGVTSGNISGLTAGTRYYIVVRARDEATNSDANTLEQSAVTWSTGVAQAIASGGNHSCALLAGGSVRCWGNNANGQLGDGTTLDRSVPTPVSSLSGASIVTTGSSHSCALLADGSVRCWGSNTSGSLGDGTTVDKTTPVAVSTLSGVVSVLGRGSRTCVLLSDGSARCWGFNANGELGDGTTANKSTPVTVSTLTAAVALAGGSGNHACALISDGTAKCWGYNIDGQLGDGTTVNKTTPVSVSTLTNAIALSAGTGHTCALVSDGTAKCWGGNSNGQLGDGSVVSKPTPVTVSTLTGVAALAGGNSFSCALESSGTVRCWGYNATGRLGDGTSVDKPTPVQVSTLTGAFAITIGQAHSCTVLNDGTARCWGSNSSGQLGDGTTADKSTPVAVTNLTGPLGVKLPRLHESTASGAPARPFREGLSTGNNHTCALLSDGTAKCWGWNLYGQIGNGTNSGPEFCGGSACSRQPVAVSTLSMATAVALGYHHTCVLLAGGIVRCSGLNGSGQLGDGTTTDRTVLVTVTSLTGAYGIAGGRNHTCALLTDGTAQCWGGNTYGQIGDGTTTDRTSPVAVSSISSALSVAGGQFHSCALLANGKARCWGYNGQGQLGEGMNCGVSSCPIPIEVSSLSSAVAIDPGENHTCALLSGGTVKCWGDNTHGQVGDGTTTGLKTTPITVTSLTGAVAMTGGGEAHSCALLCDGTVKCWGYNVTGQLGDGTTVERWVPALVSSLTGVVAVAGGWRQTCALLSDGTVKCWGRNDIGQLGDGTTANRLTPVPVVNLP